MFVCFILSSWKFAAVQAPGMWSILNSCNYLLLEMCSSFSQVLGLDPRVGGGWDVHTGLGTVTTNRCNCEIRTNCW